MKVMSSMAVGQASFQRVLELWLCCCAIDYSGSKKGTSCFPDGSKRGKQINRLSGIWKIGFGETVSVHDVKRRQFVTFPAWRSNHQNYLHLKVQITKLIRHDLVGNCLSVTWGGRGAEPERQRDFRG